MFILDELLEANEAAPGDYGLIIGWAPGSRSSSYY